MKRALYSPAMHSKEMNQQLAKAMSEDELLSNVADLAHVYHWKVAHFRSVRTQRKDGSIFYATPVAIDGEGWLDLCLVNLRDGRVLFVELKAQRGVVSDEQHKWLSALNACPGVTTALWRPSEWLDGTIENTLR